MTKRINKEVQRAIDETGDLSRFSKVAETVSRKEACKLLLCNPRSLNELIKRGILPETAGMSSIKTEDVKNLSFKAEIAYKDGAWDFSDVPDDLVVKIDAFYPYPVKVKGLPSFHRGKKAILVCGDRVLESNGEATNIRVSQDANNELKKFLL